MLKRIEGLASRGGWTLAALVLLAVPATGSEESSRAASTRGDAAVTSHGSGSASSSASSPPPAADGGHTVTVASGSLAASAGDPGRAAVARGGTPGSRPASRPREEGPVTVAASQAEGRHAVPRGSTPQRPRHADRGRSHGRHGSTVVIGGGWYWDPWWYWGPSWGGWGWWWPWGPASVRYDRPYRENGYGALDLDLAPDDVEVYVDGERVGIVDEFDGFPSFLWLPRGTYDVVFYRPGYRTLARQYSIYAGQIIDVEDRLEKGESIRPEDLQSRSTVHRDARLRRNRESEEEARRMEQWRERARERARDRADEDEEAAEERLEERVEEQDLDGAAVSFLYLQITPDDASVYLDGRFLGSARGIARLPSGLTVPAGNHRLQVVRPGYEPQEVEFDSVAGQSLELEVRLEAD